MNSLDEAGATRHALTGAGSASASEQLPDTRPWVLALEQLHALLAASPSRSRWTIEWTIHRWANEALNQSTAIRIGESEGLSGPAPAKWRILVHIDGDQGAFSLAVLPGRASRSPANVLASSISDHCGRMVIAARGCGLRWLIGRAPDEDEELNAGSDDTLEYLLDALSSGQLEERPELELDLNLAFSLARAEALVPRKIGRSA